MYWNMNAKTQKHERKANRLHISEIQEVHRLCTFTYTNVPAYAEYDEQAQTNTQQPNMFSVNQTYSNKAYCWPRSVSNSPPCCTWALSWGQINVSSLWWVGLKHCWLKQWFCSVKTRSSVFHVNRWSTNTSENTCSIFCVWIIHYDRTSGPLLYVWVKMISRLEERKTSLAIRDVIRFHFIDSK